MSLFLASKYVVPSHIHSGVFFGFCIISFNELVSTTWDNERAYNQKFGTLSIPGDFHFWDLVNAAFISSTVIFSHCCTFIFSFSCFNSSLILRISLTLVILYFFISIVGFFVFGSLFYSILSIDISPLIVSISFSI